jgi:hypothetical protein
MEQALGRHLVHRGKTVGWACEMMESGQKALRTGQDRKQENANATMIEGVRGKAGRHLRCMLTNPCGSAGNVYVVSRVC